MSVAYIVERAWVDPMENRDACGYTPHLVTLDQSVAINMCVSGGFYTEKDCWQVRYQFGGQMPKFRFSELPLVGDVPG